MNPKPRRLSPSLVVAVLALFLALGGSAIAAKRYLITTPKQIAPKALKEIAKLAGQQGASGARGPAGAPGSAGANGANGERGEPGPRTDILWAVVEPQESAAPEVIHSSEVGVNVEEVETGTYAVTFEQTVKDCAYEATIGLSGDAGTAFPGFATVVRQFGEEDSVYVQTFDKEGNRTKQAGFHLAVFC